MNDIKGSSPLIQKRNPLFTKLCKRLFQPDRDQKQLLKSTGVIALIMTLYFWGVWPNESALVFSIMLVLFGFAIIDFLFLNRHSKTATEKNIIPCSEGKTASAGLKCFLFVWRPVSLFLAFKISECLIFSVFGFTSPTPWGLCLWIDLFLLLNRGLYYCLRLPVHASYVFLLSGWKAKLPDSDPFSNRSSLFDSDTRSSLDFESSISHSYHPSGLDQTTDPAYQSLSSNIHNPNRFGN